MNPLISLIDNFKTVVDNITLAEFVQAVKTGSIRGRGFIDLISQIRNEPDKKKIESLKKTLPAVTLSATFDQVRATDKCLFHSGLMQIDIDTLPPGAVSFAELRQQLEKDAYTYICFNSPSGKIKIVAKIPESTKTHKQTFLSLEAYYRTRYGAEIDAQTKDVARLCFLSHDPNIYVNPIAEAYTNLAVPESTVTVKPPKKREKTVPVGFVGGTDAEEVEDYIRQLENRRIDITTGYKDWLKIGFAFADGFGEAGRDYFHRVSAISAAYDFQNTEKQYTACINGKGASRVTLSSFFLFTSIHGLHRTGARPAQPEPAMSAGAGEKKGGVKTTTQAKEAKEEPAAVEDLKKPIEPDCTDKTFFIDQYEFYYADSCYYTVIVIKNKTQYVRISNFVMQFLYFFPDGTNNAKWYIKLQSRNAELSMVELCAKDLTTISAFKAAVMSQGPFSFSGNQAQLDKIIEYHNTQYQKAHKITILGWQPDHNIFAFSNGIIDQNFDFLPANSMGIVTAADKSYYLPALSELTKNDSSFLNERKFIYKTGTLSFADYNRYIIQAYGINGAIGNAYLIAAIYRDIIFTCRASFPYLFLFGPPGTGKTNYTDFHLAIFGQPQLGLGISNDSTSKSIARRIAQFRNALTYLKEYTNSEIENTTIGLLKTGYEGVGYDRAQTSNDNKTHQTGVHSAIFIDGNELPEKNGALFSRTISLTFEEKIFTQEETEAFKTLKTEMVNGFGQIFHELHRLRPLIESQFAPVYHNALAYLKNEYKELAISDRTMEHVALLIAPIRILEKHIKFHITTQQIIEAVISAAQIQNEAMRESHEVQAFFQVIEFLSHELKIREDFDYHIRIDTDEVEVLSLALNLIFPKYIEHCKKTGMQPIGKSSLLAILKTKPYTRKNEQKGNSDFSAQDKTLQKRVWRFVYKDLNINMRKNNALPVSLNPF